jgi:uncharacterized membrane protein
MVSEDGNFRSRACVHDERVAAMSGSPAARRSEQRRARRTVRTEAAREYASGSLWVLPTLAAVVAVVAGYLVSHLPVRPGTMLDRLAFQGTADDARSLLIAVTSTVVTVIALVLGLTVVALQLSSTQFSPRLLRNFLRDRATQIVLSVFIATFVYSAAGLFTVGLEAGARTQVYPRLAVSGSIVLLFASLGMVVYFADHLVHSIQIDAINARVERATRRAIARTAMREREEVAPRAPAWATALMARRSGYLQSIHPELLLPLAAAAGVTIGLRPRVGQHVVAGTTIGWVWASDPNGPRLEARPFEDAIAADVLIGFERSVERDVAFGIRQQIDIATKALSPAVNDPYTAVQVIDHLTVVCCDLAGRKLGADVRVDPTGRGRVIVPGNTFGDYLLFICRLIGRYGSRDGDVMLAMLRLVRTCLEVGGSDPARLATLSQALGELESDADSGLVRVNDKERFVSAANDLRTRITHELE